MLVITRDEFSKTEIMHNGETLVMSIERICGDKIRIGFEGPLSFQVVRDDAGVREPKETKS